MAVSQDEYLEKVIKQGDRGSDILASAIVETIANCPHATIEGRPYQLPGVRVPAGKCVVINSDISNGVTLEEKVDSLVDNLVSSAMTEVYAQPLGFTNIVDSRTGDDSIIVPIKNRLVKTVNERLLAIFNGENAILGNRVVGDANISGTLISYADPEKLMDRSIPTNGVYVSKNGTHFTIFPTNGEFLFMNSDGVGTWHEFVERLGPGFWPRANRNALAMVADDAAKNGGRIIAYSGVYEKNEFEEGLANNVPDEMRHLCQTLGFAGTLQTRTGHVQSYKPGIPAFNISGSAVSIIDEERLNNLPVPNAGNYLVVLRGRIPNPRSNGITAKREGMEKVGGQEWHETPWGKLFMEFLAEPCNVFYDFFKETLDSGLASSVYHMSGGAFNSKLAKPLAKQGLYAELDNLFEADPRELALAFVTSPTIRAAYGKCPMGNEAFIATDNYPEVIKRANRIGYDARKVGKLERKEDGTTGVKFYACGSEITFSGKD